MTQYDFIFVGAGLSGLTLAVQMYRKGLLEGKSVLLLDADRKDQNDRTWCFWATPEEVAALPPVVFHQWKGCHFYSDTFQRRLDMGDYAYYMVRGKDFYDWAKRMLAGCEGLVWRQEAVTGMEASTGTVTTHSGQYIGLLILNSALSARAVLPISDAIPFRIPFTQQPAAIPYGYSHWLQHFKGWVIETPDPVFDVTCATLMDFRLQQEGETRFVYVLPFSEHRALVEFTVFSEALLQQEEYDAALTDYLHQKYGLSDWIVQDTEFGVIPMTDFPFLPQEGKVIHIGTAGGQVKPSSGYAFKRIQQRMNDFTARWQKTGFPDTSLLRSPKQFRCYDSIFLRALSDGLVAGDVVFSAFFSRLGGAGVFRFLDEKSHIGQDLKALYSVPTWPFLKAFVRQMSVLLKV